MASACSPAIRNKIALDVDRETAAERLRDVAGLAGLEIHFDTGRHHHRAHFAVYDKRLVLVRTHLFNYSVETVLAPRSSAAFKRVPAQARALHP